MADPLQQLSSQFAGLWVRQETTHGQVLVGRTAFGETVTIALLNAAASAAPEVRSTFADAVWRRSVSPGGSAVAASDLHGPRPWAAIRGEPGAEQLLDDVVGAAPTGPLNPVADQAAHLPPSGPSLAPGAYPAVPPPAPAVPPARRRRLLLALGGGVVAVVLVLVGGVAALRSIATESEASDGPGPGVLLPTGPVEPSDPAEDPSALPRLRPVVDVSLFGPTFGRSDETHPVRLAGWPFAFRLPSDWFCSGAEFEPAPEADAVSCTTSGESTLQLVHVLVWECPGGCSEAVQQQMLESWLDEAETWHRPTELPTVTYWEIDEDDQGRSAVRLGNFFGGDSDAPPRWLVGAHGAAPSDVEDDVWKILNDVLSQTL